MSRLDHRLDPDGEVRRFEVINGAVGRRRWSADERARILEETFKPGAVVSAVARRHGLTPQQLFTWRRVARKRSNELAFVPAVLAPEAGGMMESMPSTSVTKRHSRGPSAAAIEVEAAGIIVRIGDGVSASLIAAVIGALKATP